MSSPQILKIVNGRILTPKGILLNGYVLIRDGKIIDVTNQSCEVPDATIIDAKENYIAPGCIDTHIHGGGGHDFTEATTEAFYAIAQAHAQHGITSLYPTLAASSIETFHQAIQACEFTMKHKKDGANILGLHLEGNYLNMQMKGGQNPDFITLPNPDEYKELLNSTNCIKRWSASPELEGALDFGRYASENGVIVSIAHTTADYALVKKAFNNGYTHVTHFYNAMTSVHKVREYKHEGTIEGIYLVDDMSVELVGDGIHVPPAILKLVYKIKGPEKIVLVTDAMCAAAWPNAATQFNDPRIILEDGVGKLADRSALASSIATGDRLIRTMVQLAEIPLLDAVRMASESPARIMGIQEKKGSLEKGKDADIIIFDENINLLTTIVEGQIVFNR